MCALDANVNIYANFKLVSRVYLKESGNMLCINQITYKVRASWGKSHFISIQFSTVDICLSLLVPFSDIFMDFNHVSLKAVQHSESTWFVQIWILLWVSCMWQRWYFAHTLRIRGTADIFKNVDETVQIILSGSYEFKKNVINYYHKLPKITFLGKFFVMCWASLLILNYMIFYF